MSWTSSLLYGGLAGAGAVVLLIAVMVMAVGKIDALDRRVPRPADGPAVGPSMMAEERTIAPAPRRQSHGLPPEPFDVTEARREVQIHRDCKLDHCPRKVAALNTLINAGLVSTGVPHGAR